MEGRKPCIKCLLAECDESEVLEKIRKLLSLMPESEKAEPDIYNERLEICRNCESLINAQCMKCGCYVELRAAKKKERCPHEKRFW